MVATDLGVFTTKELIDWIDSFKMGDKAYWRRTKSSDFYEYSNCKTFMRSLYFRLQSQILTEGFKEICEHMEGFLIEQED